MHTLSLHVHQDWSASHEGVHQDWSASHEGEHQDWSASHKGAYQDWSASHEGVHKETQYLILGSDELFINMNKLTVTLFVHSIKKVYI